MKPGILSISLIILGVLLATSACATSSQPERPIANITFPTESSHFTVGQEVVVQFEATDVQGVNQIEVTINGQPVYVEVVNPPVNAFVAGPTETSPCPIAFLPPTASPSTSVGQF